MIIYDTITKGILLEIKDTIISVEDLKEELRKQYFYYIPRYTKILDGHSKILDDTFEISSETVFAFTLFNEIFKKNLEFYGPKLFKIEYDLIKTDFDISEIEFLKIFNLYDIRRYPEINSVLGKVNFDKSLILEQVFEKIKYKVPGIYFKGNIFGKIKADPKWISDYTIYIDWTFNCNITISKNHIKFIFKDSKFKIDHVYFDILLFLEISENFNVNYSFNDIILENFSTTSTIIWVNSNILEITNQLKSRFINFYNYNLSSDSIHIIPKNKENFGKIIIHKGPGIKIEIKNLKNYSDFSIVFDFVLNLFVDLDINLSENILKSNSSDCQKGRQPNLILGKNTTSQEMNINLQEKVSCDNPGFSYPGYTKNGTPCCFKNKTHLNLKFEIFGKENHFVFTKCNFLTKEQESEKIKSNVYIIQVDLVNSKEFTLEKSEYPYDIYSTFTFYLYDIPKKTWFKLVDSNENSIFSDNFGFKLPFPRIKGLFYYKDLLKIKVSGQILDFNENITFLVYKQTLIPIKSQPAVKNLAKVKLFIPDITKQRKTLVSLKIDFKESENWILLSDTLIKIPLTEFALNELIELEKEIFENL